MDSGENKTSSNEVRNRKAFVSNMTMPFASMISIAMISTKCNTISVLL